MKLTNNELDLFNFFLNYFLFHTNSLFLLIISAFLHVSRCDATPDLYLNLAGQYKHWNWYWSVCELKINPLLKDRTFLKIKQHNKRIEQRTNIIWTPIAAFWLNPFLQISQINFLIFVWTNVCLSSKLGFGNSFEQFSYGHRKTFISFLLGGAISTLTW